MVKNAFADDSTCVVHIRESGEHHPRSEITSRGKTDENIECNQRISALDSERIMERSGDSVNCPESMQLF